MCGSCRVSGGAADGPTLRKLIVGEGGVAVRGRPTADQNTGEAPAPACHASAPPTPLRLPAPVVTPQLTYFPTFPECVVC